MGIPLDSSSQNALYEVGDLVQITHEEHPWFPAVLIVSEVKRWGVLAHIIVPTSNIPGDTKPNIMPARLLWGAIGRVGRAIVDMT